MTRQSVKSRLPFLISLVLALLFAGVPGYADTDSADVLRSIAVYNERACGAADEQEWVVRDLAANVENGSEWYILALRARGVAADYALYADRLLEYLNANPVTNAVTRQKYALTLIACGRGDDPCVTAVTADTIGRQGIMSWIWGLHLLNNGAAGSGYTPEQVIAALLDARKPDGGWAVTGAYADADVTAMALQALAPHAGRDSAVRSAVENALTLLSAKQLDSGGFKSYGVENPDSAAQVILALRALGLDPMTDPRFIKNGHTLPDAIAPFLLPDGGVSHTLGGTANAMATAQVFLAFSALTPECGGSPYLFQTPLPQSRARQALSYKIIVCAAAAAVSLVLCAVLFLKGRRKIKSYLSVLALLGAVCAFTLLTDISGVKEYYNGANAARGAVTGRVTMSITCEKVAGRAPYIPADGVILPVTAFELTDGDTVYDLLTRAARQYGLRIEHTGTSRLAYITGIQDLYEFGFGDLSGWVYRVNGASPSVGCGEYVPRDGDNIQWIYSLELGSDIP